MKHVLKNCEHGKGEPSRLCLILNIKINHENLYHSLAFNRALLYI